MLVVHALILCSSLTAGLACAQAEALALALAKVHNIPYKNFAEDQSKVFEHPFFHGKWGDPCFRWPKKTPPCVIEHSTTILSHTRHQKQHQTVSQNAMHFYSRARLDHTIARHKWLDVRVRQWVVTSPRPAVTSTCCNHPYRALETAVVMGILTLFWWYACTLGNFRTKWRNQAMT